MLRKPENVVFALRLAACLLLPALAGCGQLNPFRYKEFAQEREFGPGVEGELAAIDTLGRRAASMPPEEQARVSAELVSKLRNSRRIVVRERAVKALANFPTPEAATGLNLALSDAHHDVRIAACRAWKRRGGEQAIEALARTVASDTDLDVRLAAVTALSGNKDPRAVQALGIALDDSDPAMQSQAIASLRSSTGRDLGGDVQAWRHLVRGEPLPEGSEQVARGWWPWQ